MIQTTIYLPFDFSTITKFYTYRTAYVCGVEIDNDKNGDLYKEVKAFVEENGYKMDNHICFSTDFGIDFMWSDNTLIVGELTAKNW